MKKIFTIIITLAFSSPLLADYMGGRTPVYTYGSKYIEFGIDNPPTDKTCNYFGRHLRFDATTPEGKNMYSMLLMAIASKRKVDVWFTPSTLPGTDHVDGCKGSNMATLVNIGVR